MDAHEGRPSAVRSLEVCERRAMRVRAAGADKDGAHARAQREVRGKSGFQAKCAIVPREI